MANHLTEKEKVTIGEVFKTHLANVHGMEIILFGSMANGTPRPTSDIDVAVKGLTPLDKTTWAKIEDAFDQSQLGRKVDVVDYWRVTPEFQKVIDEGGEKLLATKSHKFRLCPTGFHWVSTHMREIPPSLRNPSGGLTEVDGHCRVNPQSLGAKSSREYMSTDEIKEMFRRFGSADRPTLAPFTDPQKKDWNRYDREISFWTEFWNDIFGPGERLDAILVKALIGSESSFKVAPGSPSAGSAGRAHGLIQLTDQALSILNGSERELKDYFINVDAKDLEDPSISIASGVRWIFHKKDLADSSLKRESSWNEALLAYKGYLNDYKKNPNLNFKGMEKLKEHYDELARGSN